MEDEHVSVLWWNCTRAVWVTHRRNPLRTLNIWFKWTFDFTLISEFYTESESKYFRSHGRFNDPLKSKWVMTEGKTEWWAKFFFIVTKKNNRTCSNALMFFYLWKAQEVCLPLTPELCLIMQQIKLWHVTVLPYKNTSITEECFCVVMSNIRGLFFVPR